MAYAKNGFLFHLCRTREAPLLLHDVARAYSKRPGWAAMSPGQSVLEGVLAIREELRLVEELGLPQVLEPPPQDLLRLLGDCREERVGHVLTDHRGRLQDP